MRFNKGTIENFIFGNFPEAKYVSGKNGEIHFNTPFDSDNKKRLYVSSDTGKWFDQKAQRGGNKFEYFVAEYLEIPVGEAISILLKEYRDDNYEPPITVEEKKEIAKIEPLSIPEGVKFFDDGNLGFVGEMAYSYLLERKINPSGLGYISSDNPRIDKRIFIPFYENDVLVYYIARTFVKDEEFRYVNPKDLSAGDFVLNYDKITDEVFIFEGAFDALSLEFPQIGTAMLSTSLKEGQAKKILSRDPSRIIIVPDKDTKPKVRATTLKSLISTKNKLFENKKYKQSFSLFIYNLPDGYKDFNQYKMATGVGSISIDECKVFNEMEVMAELINLELWGIYG